LHSAFEMGSGLENKDLKEVEDSIQREDPIIIKYDDELTEFLKFQTEKQKTDNEEINASISKTSSKRKRKQEDYVSLNILTDIFLRIIYPISKCMTKGISVGLVKELDYTPNAILNHGAKMLFFSDSAWESFIKHVHLIECYLDKNMFGKKTAIRLLDCDIEIDIIKSRGEQVIRFRDLAKHDEKIQLTREEFFVLSCATSPITRYMKQLVVSGSVVKDYLVDATEHNPDFQILYGPIDTSVFNRIPYEVDMWRNIREYEQNRKTIIEETEKPENDVESSTD
jgi:hypothetical protein